MIAKAVLVLVAATSISYSLGLTPDQLKLLFNTIFADVDSGNHEAQIQIRTGYSALSYYLGQARTNIVQNLTNDGNKNYWDEIAAIETEAYKNGTDVSSCTGPGNAKVWALNETVIDESFAELAKYNETGVLSLIECSKASYAQIEKLLVFQKEVNDCDTDECATELSTELNKFYQEAEEAIKGAVQNSTILIKNFETYLGAVTFDDQSYIEKVDAILDEVKDCIAKL